MTLKDHRRQAEDEIDRQLRVRNEAAAIVLENNIKRKISEKGLVLSGRYLSSVSHDSDARGAVAGTNVTRDGFSYPLALEVGTRNMRPFHPMTDAAIESARDLRRIYGE